MSQYSALTVSGALCRFLFILPLPQLHSVDSSTPTHHCFFRPSLWQACLCCLI